jgi:polysaccharide chain length determinant protein (PEP-CTERM system associated)
MAVGALVQRYAVAGWRHRWKALALSWVVCIAGWAAVTKLPDQYMASARMYADADAILGQTLRGIAVDGATANQVDTLQRTLLSRPNIERVIARTDLDLRVTNAAEREELVQKLTREIKLVPQTRNLFKLEYSDHDPQVAHSVVQTLLNLFIERVSGNDRQQMDNARTFIGQQLASYEQQLRQAEQRRAEFRARYIELLPNDQLGGSSRFEASRARLAQLRGELEDAKTRRDLIAQQLERTPAMLAPEAVAGGGGGGGGGRLADAERTLRELLLTYTDQHPAVVAQRSIIAGLRAGGGGGEARAPAGSATGSAATTRPGSRPNPMREPLQLRLVDAEAELASLERQVRAEAAEMERLETLARTAPQVQAQFLNLDRDYTVLLRNYEELLARRESLQIAGAARTGADQVRLEVVEPPTVPQNPTGPNRPLFYAAVLVVGIGAGVALAGLFTLLDTSVYTLSELRQFGLPVIGAVSPAQTRPWVGGAVVFGGAFSILFVAFGAVLAGGPALVARIAQVARILA